MKTCPLSSVTHPSSECHRLKTINNNRGALLPVEVNNGDITWDDREPTPDPDEALERAVEDLKGKVEVIIEQNKEILSLLKAQGKVKAEGSKASKKSKAKESKAKEPKAKE